MKKIKTKKQLNICLDQDILKYLEDNFENKSKYVEYLIYKDLKESGVLKKDMIL